jgi:hypothetical protein
LSAKISQAGKDVYGKAAAGLRKGDIKESLQALADAKGIHLEMLNSLAADLEGSTPEDTADIDVLLGRGRGILKHLEEGRAVDWLMEAMPDIAGYARRTEEEVLVFYRSVGDSAPSRIRTTVGKLVTDENNQIEAMTQLLRKRWMS